MGEPARDDLSFEKAAYEGSSATPCSSCKAPLGQEYWKLGHYVLCEKCQGSVAATFAKAKTGSAFARAVLLGGLTALGCGIAYAVFAGVTHMRFSLVTIGIAYVVAGVVRRASGGFSGRRFQILAVLLTYLASTMGYIPDIFAGLTDSSAEHASPAGGHDSSPTPGTTAEPESHASPSTGGVVMAIFLLLGIMLAAPFLAFSSSPIGLLIVFFGLWEAWRRSGAMPLSLQGPFRVAA
jgi:hypothetical protein